MTVHAGPEAAEAHRPRQPVVLVMQQVEIANGEHEDMHQLVRRAEMVQRVAEPHEVQCGDERQRGQDDRVAFDGNRQRGQDPFAADGEAVPPPEHRAGRRQRKDDPEQEHEGVDRRQMPGEFPGAEPGETNAGHGERQRKTQGERSVANGDDYRERYGRQHACARVCAMDQRTTFRKTELHPFLTGRRPADGVLSGKRPVP